jgi:transcriptional regulator with GAF, ATPase, and Fis domain
MSDRTEYLIDLFECIVLTPNLNALVQELLPGIAQVSQSAAAFLYLADPRLSEIRFFHHGLAAEVAVQTERTCAIQNEAIASTASAQLTLVPAPAGLGKGNLNLYPLHAADTYVGMLGLCGLEEVDLPAPLLSRLLGLLSNSLNRLAERTRVERQLAHLNTYLTVSSMLAQSMDLHELLDITMYSCMEAVAAEEASVLLLDEEQKNFNFYHCEGPAKALLEGMTFPADKGLAGAVLQSRQSEIIDDVPNDPRFYRQIDAESGFPTRNMIAIPLVAGEEPVGVLEVLNKANDGDFTDEDHMLLLSIAEEIAFAIRNATVFEYVVNTYCKQRQGLNTCRGCKRPLGSWTPCVKYREAAI